MPVDHIRYDLLTREALRSVVRRVLADVARSGLPGEHHFYITFDTHAPGVRLAPRLRQEYPDAMTIVLQHQFYDLTVNDQGFEVGLSFGGAVERLVIPFEAITGFVDPSVQFGLQFETLVEAAEPVVAAEPEPPAPQAEPKAAKTRRSASPVETKPAQSDKPAIAEKRAPAKAGTAPAAPDSGPDKPSGGAEVVRLDRFRKK
jgi:hypothetical protein